MALSPFLFIGVGGTGGKTLRVIHRVLEDTLTHINWDGDWPEAWQFLHVDVASVPDGIEPDVPLTLPLEDFAPLTTGESVYTAIDQFVSGTKRTGLDHHLAWDSWRPYPPSRVDVDISSGAGQFRAVGRVAVLGDLSRLAGRIGASIERAKGAGTQAELERIQSLLRQEKPNNAPRPLKIFVVASLAGGSGSGAMLDVCDVVRSKRASEKEEVVGIVYTPEVFTRAGGKLDPGIAPNTFMGINELLNADWVQDGEDMPLSREVHFQRAGINLKSGTGPDTIFLVGKDNGRVALGGASEIYQVFGRALAEYALSETQQDKLSAYARTNRAQTAKDIKHNLSFATPKTPSYSNLYALGFARLTIGRERFRDYAAERLARLAVERLLDGHLEHRLANDPRTDKELIEDLVARRWKPAHGSGGFLAASGLDEVGSVANQITAAVLPDAALRGAKRDWVTAMTTQLQGSSQNGSVDATEAIQAVLTGLRDARSGSGKWTNVRLQEMRELGRKWRFDTSSGETTGIHRRLADAVLAETARSGFAVTLGLLKRLRDEVDEGIRDLEKERAKRDRDFEQILGEISVAKGDAKKLDTNADGLLIGDVVAKKADAALDTYARWLAASVAQELLTTIADGLVAPIEDALTDAAQLLTIDVRPTAERASPLDIWPKAAGVPKHLWPSKVEFLLDDLERFPAEFDRIISESAEGATIDASIESAKLQIIKGLELPLPKQPSLQPYVYRRYWAPPQDYFRAVDQNEVEGRADIAFRLTLGDLLERTRKWLGDKQKSVGRYIDESISQWLDNGAAGDRRARRERLVAQFREMLRTAMPLVKIDAAKYTMVHGGQAPQYEVVLGALNIPSHESELLQKLKDAAKEVRGEPMPIDVAEEGSGTHAMVTLKNPLHPVVFDSLMAPVLAQWAVDPDAPDFWDMTRARPITEWVPLSPDAQRAIVDGWISARLLGRVRVPRREDRSRVIEILVGDEHATWERLPTSSMRPVTQEDAIGNLFELLALATIEVYRDGTPDALIPYRELFQSGLDDEKHRLRVWIEDGTGLEPEGALLRGVIDYESLPVSTPVERLAAVQKALDAYELGFHKQVESVSGASDVDELQRHAGLEVARLAVATIARLRRKLGDATSGTAQGAPNPFNTDE